MGLHPIIEFPNDILLFLVFELMCSASRDIVAISSYSWNLETTCRTLSSRICPIRTHEFSQVLVLMLFTLYHLQQLVIDAKVKRHIKHDGVKVFYLVYSITSSKVPNQIMLGLSFISWRFGANRAAVISKSPPVWRLRIRSMNSAKWQSCSGSYSLDDIQEKLTFHYFHPTTLYIIINTAQHVVKYRQA